MCLEYKKKTKHDCENTLRCRSLGRCFLQCRLVCTYSCPIFIRAGFMKMGWPIMTRHNESTNCDQKHNLRTLTMRLTRSLYILLTSRQITHHIMRPALFNLTLQRRHNECDGVLKHRRLDCLFNRLFRRRSKKHQNSASLAFLRGIYRWPVNSPGPILQKMFPFNDVITEIITSQLHTALLRLGNCIHIHCKSYKKERIVDIYIQMQKLYQCQYAAETKACPKF